MLRAKLREVLDATRAYTIVHCCASGYPFEIINGAGADAVSFDLGLLGHRDYDKLAETVEGGSGLLIGALSLNGLARDSARPSASGEVGERRPAGRRDDDRERTRPTPEGTANAIREVWQRIGLPPASCAEQVVITPGLRAGGGLAGPGARRAALVPGGGADPAGADGGAGLTDGAIAGWE